MVAPAEETRMRFMILRRSMSGTKASAAASRRAVPVLGAVARGALDT